MIEGTSCSQIFSQRSAWQEEAFNELKDSLTATRENRFIKYQDEKETYLVMIWGKSQIGKSTLILKLIGIRDENFEEVYDTLRAGSKYGSSSTATAIIYARSATDQYALSFAKLNEPIPEKKYYAAQDMKAALQQVRRDVENGQHTSAEKIMFIDIPKHFFAEDAAVGSLQIMDMPGVESRNEKEWVHVWNLMDSYLPLSQVCIIACNAADIQSLGTMELPGKILWRNRPEHFMVVSTASYSPENIQEYFHTARPARKENFQTFIHNIYARTFKGVMGEKTELELYPVDLGQSLATMLQNLAPEDAAEVRTILEETLCNLRRSVAKREGRRFHAAIEDLRSRVDSYASDDLAAIGQKIREKETEGDRLAERIEKAKNICQKMEEESKEEDLQRKYEKLGAAKDRLKNLTDAFAKDTGEKINARTQALIEDRHLYRGGVFTDRYLKDQRCSEQEELADKMVFAAVLRILREQLERYWNDVCGIYNDAELEQPAKSDFPMLDIIADTQTIYYPQYYPKGLFEKVLCTDLERLNWQIAREARRTLWQGCFTVWYREIEEKMDAVGRRRSEQRQTLYEKRALQQRTEREQRKVKEDLFDLREQKTNLEKIRANDRERLKKYLEVARRHYSAQRDEILDHIREGASAEEKTKWVLMLALTDRDYEELRRTGNG